MSIARIRPAHGGDADLIHHLMLDIWQEAYAEHLPDSAFARLRAEGLAQWQEILIEPEGVWIAHRDGEPVGFARALAAGTGQARPLELDKLYVRSSEYGQATAVNLMEISTGDAPCQVWVADYNARARAFYRKNGFEMDPSEGSRIPARTVAGVFLERMVR